MADIKLSFGVDKTITANNFRQDLTSLIKQVEEELPKIKIKVDVEAVRAVQDIADKITKSGVGKVEEVMTAGMTEYNNALTKANKELARMEEFLTKLRGNVTAGDSKPYQSYVESMEALIGELKAGSLTADDFKQKFSEITANTSGIEEAFKYVSSGIEKAANETKTYYDTLKRLNDEISKMERNEAAFTNARIDSNSLDVYRKQLEAAIELRDSFVGGAASAKDVAVGLSSIREEAARVEPALSDIVALVGRLDKEAEKQATATAGMAVGTTEYNTALVKANKELARMEAFLVNLHGGSVPNAIQPYQRQIANMEALIAELKTGDMSSADFKQLFSDISVYTSDIEGVFKRVSSGVEKTTNDTKAFWDMLKRITDELSRMEKSSAVFSGAGIDAESFDVFKQQIENLKGLKDSFVSGKTTVKEAAASLSEIRATSSLAETSLNNLVDTIAMFDEKEKSSAQTMLQTTQALTNATREYNSLTDAIVKYREASIAAGGEAQVDTVAKQTDELSKLMSQLRDGKITLEQFKQGFANIQNATVDAIDKMKKYYAESVNAEQDRKSSAQTMLQTTQALTNATREYNSLTDAIVKYREASIAAGGEAQVDTVAKQTDELSKLMSQLRDGKITLEQFKQGFANIQNATVDAIDKMKKYYAESVNAEQDEQRRLEMLSSLRNRYEQMASALDKYQRAISTTDLSGEDRAAANNSISVYKEQLDKLSSVISDLSGKKIDTTAAQAGLNALNATASETLRGLNNVLKIQQTDTNRYQMLKSLNDEVTRMQETYNTFSKTAYGTEQLEAYERALNDMRAYLNQASDSSSGINELGVRFKEIQARASAAALSVKEFISANKDRKLLEAGTTEYNNALKQTTELLQKAIEASGGFKQDQTGFGRRDYAAAMKNDIASIDQLIERLRSGSLSERDFRVEIERLTTSVTANAQSMSMQGQLNAALANQVRNLTGAFSNSGVTQYITMMFSAYRIISMVTSGIRDLITKAIELENVMVDLRIVTGETDDVYADYLQTISKMSSETATNLQSLISATTTYARLGFSLDESSELAKFTGMLEKVGQIDTQKAQDAVTSIMKAFSDELDPTSIESVMDRLVTTGNNFPISVSQLAEGMLNASSALAAAGNSFDQSVALLTAANVTTQDASKSSTGLRTIAARIRNTKAELDDLGEALTEAKYEELVKMLTKHKVALTDINGEYRSTYDIIKDISQQWDSMTSMEQAALATQIAGVRQQSVFFSLVEQFKEAEGAYNAMQESAGALSTAYGEYLGSTSAHVEQLRTSWQMLAQAIFSGDTIKNVIDTGRGITDIVRSLVETNKIATTLLATFAAFKALQIGSTMLKVKANVAGITGSMIANKAVSESMVIQTQRLTAAEQQYMLSQIQSAVARGNLTAEEGSAMAQRLGLIAATETLDVSEKGLTLTQASLNAAIAANPIGAMITAFTTFYGIAKILNDTFGWSDKLSDWMAGVQAPVESVVYDVDALTTHIKETYEGFKNLSVESSGIIPRFAELAKGVDNLGNNVSLTSDEYDEFVSLQNKVAEMFPELDNGLDSNGNHLLKLQYNAESLTSTLEGLVAAQREVARSGIESDINSLFAAGDAKLSMMSGNDQFVTILRNAREAAHLGAQQSDDDGRRYYEQTVAGNLGMLAGVVSEKDIERLRQTAVTNIEEFDAIYEQVEGKVIRRAQILNERIAETNAESRQGLSDELTKWAQFTDEYAVITQKLGVNGDSLVSAMIGDTDMSQFGSADAAYSYIRENILVPLSSISDEAVSAIEEIEELNSKFATGEMTSGEFSSEMERLSSKLKGSGDNARILSSIMSKTNASQYVTKIKSVTSALKDSGDKVKKYVDALSSEDLTIAYNIVEANGSMSIDELISKINSVKLEGGTMLDTLDFSSFFEDTKAVSGSIEKITTALDKLKNGTLLTKNEMVKLAEEFPQMLKQSNLFTEGSINGQKKLLEHTLKTYKDTYAAHVQEKINELKASKEAIEAQAKLETEKLKIIVQAEGNAVAGKIDLAATYTQAIGKINQLEAQNYVEYKDGEVLVNSKALNRQYNDTSDMLSDAAENLWGEYANDVVKINRQMSMENLLTWQRMWQEQYEIANGKDSKSAEQIMKYLQGGLDSYTRDTLLGGSGAKTSYGHRTGVSTDVLAGALDSARQAVQQRLDMLAQASVDTDNAIGNLNALLDNLDTIFSTFKESSSGSGSSGSGSGSGSSSASSSSDEDSKFKRDYKEYKHKLEMDEITQAEFLKWLRDNWYKAYQDNETNHLTNDDFIKYSEEVHNGEKALEDAARKALSALVKAEQNALRQRLSDLKDFYDKQKELLKQQRQEEKYLEEQAEKRKKITDTMMRLEDLRLDNSAESQRKAIELNKVLIDAQKDLADYEKDHAVDTVSASLDAMYEAQVSDLEAAMNDPESLFNQTLASISSNSNDIKNLLLDNEAMEAWKDAVDALEQFTVYFGHNYNGIVLTGYASGTRSSTAGIHKINEAGSEMIFSSANGNQYRLFGTGDKVLDAGASTFLYNLATTRGQALYSDAVSKLIGLTRNEPAPSVVEMGDIIIQGNTDERTVSEIRRAQQEAVENMLTAFKRLRR